MLLNDIYINTAFSIDIENVLLESIYLIEEASQGGLKEVTLIKDLTRAYNNHTDTQVRLTPLEYEIALSIAQGEVANQEGKTIPALASIDYYIERIKKAG